MKKITFIFLFIAGQKLLFAQASIYHPFPDSNAVWSVASCCGSGCSTYYYCMQGDTVINSFTYHKLFNSDSICNNNWLIGGIRENNKKIYFLCLNSSNCVSQSERLLYDFNAGVGDTIQYDVMYSGTGWTVGSIDSIQLLDNKYRKKFNVGNFCASLQINGAFIIEGIGSSDHLLAGCYTGGPGFYDLLCFKQNDTLLYSDSTWNTCYYNTVSVQENNPSSSQIRVSPNPVIETGKILFNKEPLSNKYRVEIYNYLGWKIKEDISYENIFYLFKKDFIPGFYLFRIFNKKTIVGTGKFIIQ